MNPARVYKRPEMTPPPTIDIKAGMSKLFVQKRSETIIRRMTITKMQSASKKNGSPLPKKKNQDLKMDPTVKLNYPIEHVYNDDVDEHFIFHQRQKIKKLHEFQANALKMKQMKRKMLSSYQFNKIITFKL